MRKRGSSKYCAQVSPTYPTSRSRLLDVGCSGKEVVLFRLCPINWCKKDPPRFFGCIASLREPPWAALRLIAARFSLCLSKPACRARPTQVSFRSPLWRKETGRVVRIQAENERCMHGGALARRSLPQVRPTFRKQLKRPGRGTPSCFNQYSRRGQRDVGVEMALKM